MLSLVYTLSNMLFGLSSDVADFSEVWHSLEAIQAGKLVTSPFPEEAGNGSV